MKSIQITITAILLAGLATLVIPAVGLAQQPAATVQSLSGTCILNRGESAETLTVGASLFTGDSITCPEGSDATIAYSNACAVSMPAESQLTIGSGDEPCKVLAAALIIPGAAAATTAATLVWAAGFAAVPIVAAIDSTIKNNSENKISAD